MDPRWGIFPRLAMSTPPGPGTAGRTRARTGEAGGSAATVSTGRGSIPTPAPAPSPQPPQDQGRKRCGKGREGLQGGPYLPAASPQPPSDTWSHGSLWARLNSPPPPGPPQLCLDRCLAPHHPPLPAATSAALLETSGVSRSGEDHITHICLRWGPPGRSPSFSCSEPMSLLHPKQASAAPSDKLPQHHLPSEPTHALTPFQATKRTQLPSWSCLRLRGWLATILFGAYVSRSSDNCPGSGSSCRVKSDLALVVVGVSVPYHAQTCFQGTGVGSPGCQSGPRGHGRTCTGR